MRVLLVAYDNDSYIHNLPIGLLHIAAIIKQKGHEVELYNQDWHHYPDAHLTRYLDNNPFDIICLSVIGGYYQYHKLLSLSTAINQSKKRPFFIIGGHGPSPEPEYFLNKTQADMIVIGEGENTISEVLDHLEKKTDFSDVKGIAYQKNAETFVTPRRPLIQNLDTIPIPAYEMFPMEYYRLLRMPHAVNSDFVMPMLSGRGCTFKCNFCYRLDTGFRARSNESIVEEIKFLKANYGITYLAFMDELLMSSIQRVESICHAFIAAKLNVKWDCNGRLNFAKPALLKLMKQAGCVFINYGIEAFDDQILKNMNKCLTTKQIKTGIEATLAANISPGYNIIFGNIGETKATLKKGVDFLLKYDNGAQLRTIRPVTPYPGSPLYYYAIKNGLLKDCKDFYENKHLNSDLLSINFTNLTDKEFHKALYFANKKLFKKYFKNKLKSQLDVAKKLYYDCDANFRGFRQT